MSGLADELSSGTSGTEDFEDELDISGDTDISGDDEANASLVDGVWKSDGSRHTIDGPQM